MANELGQKSLELARNFGYLYYWEVIAIQLIAKDLPKNSICVNIGAGSGTSSLAILEARPDLAKTFYTVDISKGGPLGGLENERNAFKEAGLKFPNQILGDSYNIGLRWDELYGLDDDDLENKLDYCFIDGDHSEDGISKDIKAWLINIKSGGVMAFHDYGSPNWPAVKSVIDSTIAPRYSKIISVDTFIAFRIQ